MRTSLNGIKLIKEFESLHDGDLKQIGLQPKMCPAGIWTAGYGRALRDGKGNFIKGSQNKDLAYMVNPIQSEEEAEKALVEDLTSFELSVSKKITAALKQNQFDALVSYWYNTGGSDTLAKLINTNAPKEKIQNWFETKYITANGVKLNGLIRRRKAESELFFK